jgi:hypothetical protein
MPLPLSLDDEALQLAWGAASEIRAALRDGAFDAARATMMGLYRLVHRLPDLPEVSAAARLRVGGLAVSLAHDLAAARGLQRSA